MAGCHSILAATSDRETAIIAHVYIGTHAGQLTADSGNRDSQQYIQRRFYTFAKPVPSIQVTINFLKFNYLWTEIE